MRRGVYNRVDTPIPECERVLAQNGTGASGGVVTQAGYCARAAPVGGGIVKEARSNCGLPLSIDVVRL